MPVCRFGHVKPSPKPPRQRHPCSGASITDSAVGDLNPDTRHPVLNTSGFEQADTGSNSRLEGLCIPGLDWSRLPEAPRYSCGGLKSPMLDPRFVGNERRLR
ncbi:hypothetical protein MCOR27_007979 [Pyricularia oryzae]|uniref:Uncharacterized protein n=1 Tax=Pyricularia oryzae TaxID=318829 RepID=A0A4P7NN76_PYROR|nr:hypothetical protein MCOR01_002173 [Pyricularia oryzae]KAH9429246.1 hypothetical protein MCOR02_010653 [Pyricularia oryzae]KAI6261273.1 hypothetical protein MCOR19_002442 [Pyricularia oryzae]KAI6273238.1 hypothetical protein MCOR27_007979 [Pyricularia oryzae]KAI6288242.1 hypothetical protein MCOR26_000245 [Pyricularia oryzae]